MSGITLEVATTIWVAQDITVFSDGFAVFYIAYLGKYTGKDYREYRIRVNRDGTWNAYAAKAGWWKEINGVCEEAEPLLKATLRKAQALLILKG